MVFRGFDEFSQSQTIIFLSTPALMRNSLPNSTFTWSREKMKSVCPRNSCKRVILYSARLKENCQVLTSLSQELVANVTTKPVSPSVFQMICRSVMENWWASKKSQVTVFSVRFQISIIEGVSLQPIMAKLSGKGFSTENSFTFPTS